jgi:hypothetical protein
LPYKVPKPCRMAGCVNTASSPSGYCDKHALLTALSCAPLKQARRPSPASIGYGSEWRRIRSGVLSEAGIPRDLWRYYDVHHEPAYNPAIEPDHRKYNLIPIPHGDHSSETNRQKSLQGRGDQISVGKRLRTEGLDNLPHDQNNEFRRGE